MFPIIFFKPFTEEIKRLYKFRSHPLRALSDMYWERMEGNGEDSLIMQQFHKVWGGVSLKKTWEFCKNAFKDPNSDANETKTSFSKKTIIFFLSGF